MNLQSMLPFLKGWKFDIIRPTNYVVPAGQFQEVFHSKNFRKQCTGYVLGIGATSNNPLVQLETLHFGPENQERFIIGSPFALAAAGAQYPNGSGFWHGTYNAVLGVYTAFYNPDSRIGFWNSEMRIRIVNPTALTINVTGYYHTIVIIMNEKEWRNSIHKFLQSNVFKVKGLKTKVKE